MSQRTGANPGYTMGYSEEFRQLLDRRSAATHASYLLPHLERGLKVLDFGCGPGTISVGLAEKVAPGELHGIDMEESQIELARAAAVAGGHGNMTFHAGNVYEMPFEDGTFDVAHCHAVLMHIPDTQRALAEVKRVLRPGGDPRQPRGDRRLVLPGAAAAGDHPRLGRVRRAGSGQRRAPELRPGTQAVHAGGRIPGCQGICQL